MKTCCHSSSVRNYGLLAVVTTLNPYSLAKHSCALTLSDLAYPMVLQTPFQYLPIPARLLILYFAKTLIIVVTLLPLEIIHADIKLSKGKDP